MTVILVTQCQLFQCCRQFRVADITNITWVTYLNVEMVMHNLCIFKIIESWQLSHNEAKIADLQKSPKRLNNELSLNRLKRMRPQTKININRKETRIFGAVYERVYDEISWILRNNDFSYFKAFKVLKNLRFWEFSENSVRSQKFKNQEAWKVKAGNNSISNHFWFLSF